LKVETTVGGSIELVASRGLRQSSPGQDSLNHEPIRLCV